MTKIEAIAVSAYEVGAAPATSLAPPKHLLPGIDGSFSEAMAYLLSERPNPLRAYDQIHMRLEDLVWHLQMVAPLVDGKNVFFMGDSDGVAIGLAFMAAAGLGGPKRIVLADFDERVLRHATETAESNGFGDRITTCLYNVFDPLPQHLWEAADFFHTNPPYGRYNGGRSIEAFVERALAATRPGGRGLVILANDGRIAWTQRVLRSVLRCLLNKGITPVAVQERCHRYHLDDEPNLESGFILCGDLQPEYAISPHHPLPRPFRNKFYGRRTIRIPQSITLDKTQQLMLNF